MQACRIAIAGGGVSGFATLGYLVQAFRHRPEVKVVVDLFQPHRQIEWANLTGAQRDRLTHLQAIGIDPGQLLGGGQVYHPVQPSLFTFNGSSAARGFNFVHQRYDTTDYFEWIQANRPLLAVLYPDFAPENGQQLHLDHTLDDIHGTTPRGAFGLYLHDKFLALQANLPENITLRVVPEAVTQVSQLGQIVRLKTTAMMYEADYFVQATGHRWLALPADWAGRVFRAYPCDAYSQKLPSQVTVVGAGPAGIEVALHALHNLGVAHVTLVSRGGQARLPAVEPTEVYQCRWLTRENMLIRPTAIAQPSQGEITAQRLLQQELENCYRTCNLPYPGWDALLHIDDYPAFLRDYLALTQQCPNHPLAHLVRPVMSFYAQVQDLLSASDRAQLWQLIHRVKPLFATQSRPCADLLLSAIEKKRLTLISGEFLPSCTIPTILRDNHTQWQPECVILATGLAQAAPLTLLAEPAVNLLTELQLKQRGKVTSRCYQVAGTSLSSVHRRVATAASTIVQQRMNNYKALNRMTDDDTPQPLRSLP